MREYEEGMYLCLTLIEFYISAPRLCTHTRIHLHKEQRSYFSARMHRHTSTFRFLSQSASDTLGILTERSDSQALGLR